jgi:hypothetical protein
MSQRSLDRLSYLALLREKGEKNEDKNIPLAKVLL